MLTVGASGADASAVAGTETSERPVQSMSAPSIAPPFKVLKDITTSRLVIPPPYPVPLSPL